MSAWIPKEVKTGLWDPGPVSAPTWQGTRGRVSGASIPTWVMNTGGWRQGRVSKKQWGGGRPKVAVWSLHHCCFHIILILKPEWFRQIQPARVSNAILVFMGQKKLLLPLGLCCFIKLDKTMGSQNWRAPAGRSSDCPVHSWGDWGWKGTARQPAPQRGPGLLALVPPSSSSSEEWAHIPVSQEQQHSKGLLPFTPLPSELLIPSDDGVSGRGASWF